VKPIGAARPISVDVRIIAATNRDLREEVNRGAFREDLYYRLAVACIRLLPLREHAEDIPLLVRHFLRQHSLQDGVTRTFSDPVVQRLVARPWPGNVRELRNVIEQIVAFGSDDAAPDVAPRAHLAGAAPFKVAKARVIEQFERDCRSPRDHIRIVIRRNELRAMPLRERLGQPLGVVVVASFARRSAPWRRIASSFVAGASAGVNTTNGRWKVSAAAASARPWLPADAVTSCAGPPPVRSSRAVTAL